MRFTVENGLDVLAVGFSDIGSYFKYKRPLSAVWYDCRGSIGQYYALLPYSREYRNSMADLLTDHLEYDFSKDLEGLKNLLSPLIRLPKNGTYHLNFHHNRAGELFMYQSSRDDFSKNHFSPLHVCFGDVVEKEREEELKASHSSTEHGGYQSDFVSYCTQGNYDQMGSDLYATQPKEQIDPGRVQHFVNRIQKGARPFAILMQASIDDAEQPHEYDESSRFIVDGHHKLLAYQELSMYPPLAIITQVSDTKGANDFDFEGLEKHLYKAQFEHLWENCEDKQLFVDFESLPDSSVLFSYTKHGCISTYHSNSVKATETNYQYDILEGSARQWDKKGNLVYERNYHGGMPTGTSQHYYSSGKLKSRREHDENGSVKRDTQYYPNGSIQKEQIVNGVDKTLKEWYQNGELKSEEHWTGSTKLTHKEWNEHKELIHSEKWDSESNTMVVQEVPMTKADRSNKRWKTVDTLGKRIRFIGYILCAIYIIALILYYLF